MTWTKEDEQKIKQLVFSDDNDSVHVGISLAIYTLGMTVKELVDLIDESCIKVVGDANLRESKAFNTTLTSRYSNIYHINFHKDRANEKIANYLNELTQEERFEELLKLIRTDE